MSALSGVRAALKVKLVERVEFSMLLSGSFMMIVTERNWTRGLSKGGLWCESSVLICSLCVHFVPDIRSNIHRLNHLYHLLTFSDWFLCCGQGPGDDRNSRARRYENAMKVVCFAEIKIIVASRTFIEGVGYRTESQRPERVPQNRGLPGM